MKRIVLLVAVVCSMAFAALAQKQDVSWAAKVGARKFPAATATFPVNNYGAVGDGQTLNTKAIQAAIDACAGKGGGVVSFAPGNYVTGALFLKNGVNLNIGKGVTLLGSQNFDDYPEINTRIAGIETTWPAALLNVIGQKNVAITGEGTVNARGKFCWDKYWDMRKDYEKKGLRCIVDYDAKRVRTLLVQESSDISLKGITLKNAGFWTVQLLYSDHLTVDGLVIRNNEDGHGPSTDGIDIDSSTWVLVQNCDVDCNDDDFCLKAGRDADGLRVNRPTEYVVIRKCIARKGAGIVTLGSETSGGINHVLATDLMARGTKNGFLIKSALTRGGTISDIYIRNIDMDSVSIPLNFTMNWNPAYSYSKLPAGYQYDSIPVIWKKLLQQVTPEQGRPYFKDVYVDGIKARNSKQGILAIGLEESALQHFEFANVTIEASTAGEIKFAKGWKAKNVTITATDGSKVTIPGE
ncbi:Glycosyl hydrolases family 28 [Filimonas lacunae]|uniref:Glycosyl hydrolases family 28 n=1 Tax=Filimonas lacunae TaxID=477680 RepID=A0A173MN88_9BACT|nr:glycosyl hydrolase family 28 protein [Filimonas lacunae]BAV08861.1 polygalacturonase [Filimonas lacunae]SIS62952.1 Glycosyl hydrolases family 28 [Filimonas lacunae]